MSIWQEQGFHPRPAQQEILRYTGGPMGISAVPGSGKTFTLSLLAAQLVERLAAQGAPVDTEVLVVTFTNSAVANFRSRIAQFLHQDRGLLPGVGYRVRTLHGLAHDIVRERPSLVGLGESFTIVDDRTAAEIVRESVLGYLRMNPDALAPYILPEYLQNFRRIERYVVDDSIDIANATIRTAKVHRIEPHTLQIRLREQSGTWPLVEMGIHVYADYQRSLQIRGAVDFDDLIGLALTALDADPNYLTRLQDRWPYVLEDEAQDSSLLQEKMLQRLTERRGNWVRVGDPNQAINTTFTSADTRYLRNFIHEHAAQSRTLPNSGRSALPIIALANQLNRWSRTEHPWLSPDMALAPPLIEPTPPGDPQPNPKPGDPAVHIYDRELTPDQELDVVTASLRRWLPDHTNWTVAVLVPENHRGFRLSESLQAAGLPFDDSLLRATSSTRAAVQALALTLTYIARPHLTNNLDKLWAEVWWPLRSDAVLAATAGSEAAEAAGEPKRTSARLGKVELPQPAITFGRALRQLNAPEEFLFPVVDDWLDNLDWMNEVEGFRTLVETFRHNLQRWTAAAILPVDELLLTLGNDLFAEPVDLALTHHLAVLMAKIAAENPTWRLPELAGELDNIAQNRRRMLNFAEDAAGFQAKPGEVTVATMHAAKGLEWDRVYLMAINDFSFPSGSPDDSYRGERWYVRDNLNLVAESIAQIEQVIMGTLDDFASGAATRQARLDIAAERLRLLYVGITRARREVILTYNTGRNPERDPNEPALAFQALLEQSHSSRETATE